MVKSGEGRACDKTLRSIRLAISVHCYMYSRTPILLLLLLLLAVGVPLLEIRDKSQVVVCPRLQGRG